MGSYNYTDFVTDLPIKETSEKTYVLIVAEEQPSRLNKVEVNHINEHFTPMTFPLFGKYVGYGEFELDSRFEKQNQLALNYTKKELLTDGLLDVKYLEEDGLYVFATLHDYYSHVVFEQNMPKQHKWTGIFKEDETFERLFDDRIESFDKWMREVEERLKQIDEKDTYGIFKVFASNECGSILLPDVHKTFDLSRYLVLEEITCQNELLKGIKSDKDIYTYLLGWLCFYHYLGFIKKPFRPVSTGVTHFGLTELRRQKELELEALKALEEEHSQEN